MKDTIKFNFKNFEKISESLGDTLVGGFSKSFKDDKTITTPIANNCSHGNCAAGCGGNNGCNTVAGCGG